MLRARALFLAFAIPAPCALGQSGMLDQESPYPVGTSAGAWFNYDAPSLTWQQQARVGIAGQLEGFELTFAGPAGSSFDVRLRVGDGWNTSAVVWSGVGMPVGGMAFETAFFDLSSLGLSFAVGDTFVLEIQGNGSGANGFGSYIAPPGTPLYAENLYLGGPGCFADCGWRLAFRTWMLGGLGTGYCFGDGSGAPCPCGNFGGPGQGCMNSTGMGASLEATGGLTVMPDVLEVSASNLIPGAPALLFVGDNAVNAGLGVAFGDGLRCAGSNVKRLGVRIPDANGDATWGPGLASAGGWAAGDTRRVQSWYRDTPGPCGTGFNLSHGLELTFVP